MVTMKQVLGQTEILLMRTGGIGKQQSVRMKGSMISRVRKFKSEHYSKHLLLFISSSTPPTTLLQK
jgi:hypothetical protein